MFKMPSELHLHLYSRETRGVPSMSLPDWRNEKLKRLDQQVAMLKKTFNLFMKEEISDREFSFLMSDHFASFAEILRNTED